MTTDNNNNMPDGHCHDCDRPLKRCECCPHCKSRADVPAQPVQGAIELIRALATDLQNHAKESDLDWCAYMGTEIIKALRGVTGQPMLKKDANFNTSGEGVNSVNTGDAPHANALEIIQHYYDMTRTIPLGGIRGVARAWLSRHGGRCSKNPEIDQQPKPERELSEDEIFAILMKYGAEHYSLGPSFSYVKMSTDCLYRSVRAILKAVKND